MVNVVTSVVPLSARDQPSQRLDPKRRVAKDVHISVVLQSKLAWQPLEYFCIGASFSKTPKIPVKHERGAHLPRQQSLQTAHSPNSIHRLHVSPCGSPNDFRLNRRKL